MPQSLYVAAAQPAPPSAAHRMLCSGEVGLRFACPACCVVGEWGHGSIVNQLMLCGEAQAFLQLVNEHNRCCWNRMRV